MDLMKLRVKDPSAVLEVESVAVTIDFGDGEVQGIIPGDPTEWISIGDALGASVEFGLPDESGHVVVRHGNGGIQEFVAAGVTIELDQISPELYQIMTGHPAPEPEPEGTNMSYLNTARAEVTAAREAVARAERALKAAESASYPKEPAAARSIVRFSRAPKGSGQTYDYAAIKANRRWFTTGATCPPQGFTWKELIDWVRKGSSFSPLQVMVATGGDKLRIVEL